MKISDKLKTKGCLLLSGLLVFSAVALSAGCGSRQPAGPREILVKTIPVIQKDTPLVYEFVGEVEPRDEVALRARVSGMIVQKPVQGGSAVSKGQLLFVIDSRQYQDVVLDFRSQVASVEANLARVQRDVERYSQLYRENAISQQILDNTVAEEKQTSAQLQAVRARLRQAEIDVQETSIYSPLNGRIDTNTLSVGSHVIAGQTVMGTVSNIDPVRVGYSISQSDYLRFAKLVRKQDETNLAIVFPELEMILSNGVKYPLKGKVDQVERGLARETGTLTLKAVFANPEKILVPGMFVRLQMSGEVVPNALLVPQRAVQQLLNKTLISVVDKDSKVLMKLVTMGPRIGNDLWLVESGLEPGDMVIVEGFQNLPQGTPVKAQQVTLADLSGAKAPEEKAKAQEGNK